MSARLMLFPTWKMHDCTFKTLFLSNIFVTYQELPSSGDESLFNGLEHRKNCCLVQFCHLGCLRCWVFLKVGLDCHTNHILDGVHDLVHLGALNVVPSLQTKLCCQEPGQGCKVVTICGATW